MLATLAIIVGIGLIIGLHELTHMLIAKKFGVKVLKFSMGFGPRLFAKQWGETTYELRLLPLGGFVQFHGEDPEDDKTERGFFALPWYKRALIAGAAPVTNLVLGFLLAAFALYFFKDKSLEDALGSALYFTSMIITETVRWIFGVPSAAVEAAGGTNEIGGPITVFKVMAGAFKEGLLPFFAVLSLVSTSIGLFNLFPIPGLDGGHVLLYTLEGIRGKRFSQKVYAVWNIVGFTLIMLLMVYALMCDFKRL